MHVLGIETSCDETAVAIVEVNPPSHKASEGHLGQIKVLSNIVSSQVKLHAKYGGVVPNLAAREHVKNIEHVFKLALHPVRSLARAKSTSPLDLGKATSYGIKEAMDKIDLIAVTRGPGLGPALLVGIAFAKTLTWKYKKPLVGINHLEGHIYSNWLPRAYQLTSLPAYQLFPILNLIVSGGHTELVLMENLGEYKLIGETLDDAVGEAFDKVARLLNLGYPGGPIVSKLAEQGNPNRYPLPSPMINSKDFNFSYSGLKTAVLYLVRDLGNKLDHQQKKDICASFQKAAIDVLIKKTTKAAREYKAKSIFLSGGVSANKHLRLELAKATKELKVNYSQPKLEYTGDNAAMIALAGYFSAKNKKSQNLTWDSAEMDANLGF